jgi:hypothetical protein
MTDRRPLTLVALLVTVFAAACTEAEPFPSDSVEAARRHVTAFAAHDVDGAEPGSDGERRAIEYASQYLDSLGLATTIETIPLVSMVPTAVSVQVRGPDGAVLDTTSSREHLIVWAGRQEAQVDIDTEVVFAGYGIVSPEYHRDDYKDVDVNGKLVLVLEGSPQTNDRDDLGVLGQTYYGTTHYKFAEAASRGAAGALIVHGDRGTLWSDLQASASGSVLEIDASVTSDDTAPRAEVHGWLARPAADRFFSAAGLDYALLATRAHELAFRPVEVTGVRVALDLTSEVVRRTSYYAMAILPGETSEYVMVSGRWNRLDPEVYTGATLPLGAPARSTEPAGATPPVDDGSSAAVVLETARLAALRPRPQRGVVFLITTALKPGIVALEHFIEAPPATLAVDDMTALIVMDHADLEGTNKRVAMIGIEADEALVQIARGVALSQNRLFERDDSEHKHFYYRFSETAFAEHGIRSIYLTTQPEDAHVARTLEHAAARDAVVGLRGQGPGSASETHDAALLVTITLLVANSTNWPPRLEPQVSLH